MTIGECYGLGDYTLQDELDKYGEDIIVAQYNLKSHEGPNGSHPYIEWFRAWTKTHAMCMVSSGFGDNVILALDREIPEELEVKFKRPVNGDEFFKTYECSSPGYNTVVKIDIDSEVKKSGRSEEKRKRAKRRNSKTNKRKR